MNTRTLRATVAAIALACCIGIAVLPQAAFGAGAPAWSIHSTAEPTNFNPTDTQAGDTYVLVAVNAGSAATAGAVTITDTLPPGVVLREAEVREPRSGDQTACTLSPLQCTYAGEPVQPGGELITTVRLKAVSATLTGPLTNEATVSGGGAPASASTSASNPVNVGPAGFGLEQVGFETVGADGAPDAQAGDHPYSVSTLINFSTIRNTATAGERIPYRPAQEAKDIVVELPLGFAGDPLAAERCPEVDLTVTYGIHTACPLGSIVGSLEVTREGGVRSTVAVYNVTPAHGYPAEFGFNVGLGQPTVMYANVVPSPEGYRLQIAIPGTLRGWVEGSLLTVFGEPGAHNGTGTPSAFVANPTACSGEPLKFRVLATSWEGGVDSREAVAYPGVTGCDLLAQGASAFDPRIEVHPEQSAVDSPSGYEVDLRVPQASDVFGQRATSDLRDASLTLPAGVALSPGAASGAALEACTAGEIDLLGTEAGEGHPGGNGSPYDDGLLHASPGRCPEGSRVGDVEVTTPLLAEPLHGHAFVAAPACGGAGQPECTTASAENGELFGLYLELSGSGVITKLHARMSVDAQTGQITATITESPQVPFEEFKLKLYGGQRAVLANPQTCGVVTASSEIVPWSAPQSGANPTPSSPFTIDGCGAATGAFAPVFAAGTAQPLAGGFSPFTLRLSRQDGEQDIGGLSVTLPAGLSGIVSSVAQCGEAAANAGTCPESSRVGTAHVAAGSGSEPLWLEGQVYFTGPYKNSPFGLVVVVPAKAGPLNLGNEVVRVGINIDPRTVQVTTTTEPLRLIRDGVPFRIKAIEVTLDRPQFIVNPTNCSQEQVTANVTGITADGAVGSTAHLSTPFAVAGCKDLPFQPSFRVSTQAATSKADGASLTVSLGFPHSGNANFAKTDVQLPKQLAARLTTLQKACTETQFAADPAGCPEQSDVGTVVAHTPVLGVPLQGPAYLVSHGGQAFPELVFVLQGEGVTVDLAGETTIQHGITSSKFEAVPDEPISSFQLTLPEGPYSALAAPGGNLCAQKLVMPTRLVGQNGAQITQNTQIEVQGCSNGLTIVSHKATSHALTLKVTVPAAGKLTASGKGLDGASKTSTGRETLTLKLARRKTGRLHTKVTLRFTPKHGRKFTKTLTITTQH